VSDPTAAPIALGRAPDNACTSQASAPNSSPNVSLPRRSNYLTTSRLDGLEGSLLPADYAVLGFVSEVRLATSHQLMRMFWATREADPTRARAGREALRRLAKARVLHRLPRVVGGVRAGSDGYVYAIGPAGVRLLSRRGLQLRRYGNPGDRYVAHTLAITEVVVSLHEAHRSGQLELIEVQTEPRCHRSYLGGFGGIATLKPDLFLRLGVGAYEDRLFVEVDLSTEGPGTIAAKLAAYLQHYRSGAEQSESGVYPGVLWLVPDVARAEQFRGILKRQRGGVAEMHEVALQSDLVSRLTAEVSS
jgi:hypothetical protein